MSHFLWYTNRMKMKNEPTYHFTTDHNGLGPAQPLADIVRHINRMGFGYVTEVRSDDSQRELYEGDGWYYSQELGSTQPYDGGGWAGDGSGTDDLADFNAMEACDYE